MIEEIKNEINGLNKYLITTPDLDRHEDKIETFKVIKLDELFKILDKHNNQPDYKKEILHIGSRTGKTLQQVQDMVNYIKENKLTEYNIKVLEVPNNYKSAWEELKNLEIGEDERGDKYYFKSDGTMEELEQKYNLGGE